MWVISKGNKVVSKDEYSKDDRPLGRKRNRYAKFVLGTLNDICLGVYDRYPTRDTSMLVEGSTNNKGKFGFFLKGKDLETGEDINSYFENKNEVFVVYDGDLISPSSINPETKCIVRIDYWEAHEKIIEFPQVIYPIYLKEPLIDRPFNNGRDFKKRIKKYIPHFMKYPQIWTR